MPSCHPVPAVLSELAHQAQLLETNPPLAALVGPSVVALLFSATSQPGMNRRGQDLGRSRVPASQESFSCVSARHIHTGGTFQTPMDTEPLDFHVSVLGQNLWGLPQGHIRNVTWVTREMGIATSCMDSPAPG